MLFFRFFTIARICCPGFDFSLNVTAGRRKIPHILYPDSSDLAMRSKYVAWRVAVEMSQSVAQLIYLVTNTSLNLMV